jgi:hypothetical protein
MSGASKTASGRARQGFRPRGAALPTPEVRILPRSLPADAVDRLGAAGVLALAHFVNSSAR